MLKLRCLALVIGTTTISSFPMPRAMAQKTAIGTSQTEWRDNFTRYSIGGDIASDWEDSSVDFEVRRAFLNGPKVLWAGGIGGRSDIIWRAVPYARGVRLEATVTPLRARGRGADWKISGVGLRADEHNYWHLAFVEAPTIVPSVDAAAIEKPASTLPSAAHFVEMSEMLNGVWNAQSEAATRLISLAESPPFAWQYGVTYQLTLALEKQNGRRILRGEVREGGALRWKSVRVLADAKAKTSPRAVMMGRPMLSVSGIETQFSDAHAAAIEAVLEPKLARNAIPPFQMAPMADNAKAPHQAPSGFFRVGAMKDAARNSPVARWWLFDPNGRAMLGIGTDHVNYNAHFSEKMGYAPYHRNVERRFGRENVWARRATSRLKDWHFNLLGTGNSPGTRYRGLAHTEFAGFGGEFSSVAALVEKTNWTGFPDVFDARWARFCDRRARQLASQNRDDPWLLGYFLDNELEWWGKSGEGWGIALDAAKQAPDSAGKRALLATLRAAYKNNIGDFNADFGATLNSFAEFPALSALPAPKNARARAALMKYIEEVARKYFEVTTRALRRYDSHHLILGNRIAFDAPEAAWRWAGKTSDIVSVNIYPRVDFNSGKVLGLSEHLKRAHRLTKRPIMVTEWSFPALDAHDSSGRTIPSLHGAGMRVDTQNQKARAFALMQAALFRTPFVVGSDYFMWADEPALGISTTFPEDSNYGLVDENDEAYREVTAAARVVNAQAVALHAGASWHPPATLQIKLPGIPLAPAAKVLWSGENNEIALENGALRLQNKDGRVLVSGRDGDSWTELGLYSLLLQERVEGQNRWVNADRIESVTVREKSSQRMVFVVVFGGGATNEAGATLASPQSWRGAARLTIEAGKPYFTTRCLWIENSAARPLDWPAYYHYTPSQIGGDGKDDTLATPDVPNYWLAVGAWRDAARGWQFGAVSSRTADEEKMHTSFWRDEGGGQHPDTSRKVESHLAPGARWTAPADEPSLIVFGLRETPTNARPWAALALSTR